MEFYGTDTDTFVKTDQGIFLVASQDRDILPGDYEQINEIPEGAVDIPMAIIDQELIDDLFDMGTDGNVAYALGCPECGEIRADSLVWDDDGENVTCQSCGNVYVP